MPRSVFAGSEEGARSLQAVNCCYTSSLMAGWVLKVQGNSVTLDNSIVFSAAAKSLQSCQTLCHPIDCSPPGSPVPGILQARTLEGCHFLLQCMKVKSESEVALSCQTLSDPVDCSLPGSSVHGIVFSSLLIFLSHLGEISLS